MTPISRIVNSSRVSSDFDPYLPYGSILIKWRPVSPMTGVELWETNQTTLIPGSVFVSWLVSVSTEEIRGFIVTGLV